MIKFILKHIVKVKRRRDTDEFGKATYDFYEKVPARIELSTQYTVNQQGKQIVCDGIAYFDCNFPIKMQDLIEDDAQEQYIVVGVTRALNFRGKVHHYEALISYTDKNE